MVVLPLSIATSALSVHFRLYHGSHSRRPLRVVRAAFVSYHLYSCPVPTQEYARTHKYLSGRCTPVGGCTVVQSTGDRSVRGSESLSTKWCDATVYWRGDPHIRLCQGPMSSATVNGADVDDKAMQLVGYPEVERCSAIPNIGSEVGCCPPRSSHCPSPSPSH